jgi:hypothetical protein
MGSYSAIPSIKFNLVRYPRCDFFSLCPQVNQRKKGSESGLGEQFIPIPNLKEAHHHHTLKSQIVPTLDSPRFLESPCLLLEQ